MTTGTDKSGALQVHPGEHHSVGDHAAEGKIAKQHALTTVPTNLQIRCNVAE
jgi:hypothetical protein